MKKECLKTWLIQEFYPLNKFKNANVSKSVEQLNHFLYNKENRNYLEIPILNWSIICSISSILLLLFKKYDIESSHQIITATVAIIFTISFIQSFLFLLIYTYLNHTKLIKTSS